MISENDARATALVTAGEKSVVEAPDLSYV
jgi:hypothetical protein